MFFNIKRDKTVSVWLYSNVTYNIDLWSCTSQKLEVRGVILCEVCKWWNEVQISHSSGSFQHYLNTGHKASSYAARVKIYLFVLWRTHCACGLSAGVPFPLPSRSLRPDTCLCTKCLFVWRLIAPSTLEIPAAILPVQALCSIQHAKLAWGHILSP